MNRIRVPQVETITIGSHPTHERIIVADYVLRELQSPADARRQYELGETGDSHRFLAREIGDCPDLTRNRIHPGGVFALWSADPPEESLTDGLNGVFESVRVRETKFYNPLLGLHDVNYIVVAQRAPSC